jgi:hypothetical protein
MPPLRVDGAVLAAGDAKEVEILVLRHQLANLRHARVVTSPWTAAGFLAAASTRS